MMRWLAALACLAASVPAAAQDTAAWLASQNLEAAELKRFQDLEIAIMRVKAALDPNAVEERVAILRQGKPIWQSTPRDAEPGSKWTIHSIGRDLDGNGQPDLHLSSFSGGAHCCTTHHVIQLKPQPRRIATHSAGNVGGGEFVELPGRKAPVMISADDASAFAFAPFANSYFPLVILEIGPKGRFQFARDLMQTRLPGHPPPICATPAATANLWLKERCGEYSGPRRQERTRQIKQRLLDVKSSRAAEKIRWEDYFENGVLAAVSAEMNRYAYTGHGHASMSWLETVWPGNDSIKVRFVNTLRQSQAKSVFADDLRTLAPAR